MDRRLTEVTHPFLPVAGFVALTTAAIGVCALLILRNESLVAFGSLLTFALLLAVMVRWQRGVYGLLLYLPISGAVTIVSYEPVGDGRGHVQAYKVVARRE